mgnify:CR=1 FL=1
MSVNLVKVMDFNLGMDVAECMMYDVEFTMS